MIEPGTRGHRQAFSQKTIILYYIIYYRVRPALETFPYGTIKTK